MGGECCSSVDLIVFLIVKQHVGVYIHRSQPGIHHLGEIQSQLLQISGTKLLLTGQNIQVTFHRFLQFSCLSIFHHIPPIFKVRYLIHHADGLVLLKVQNLLFISRRFIHHGIDTAHIFINKVCSTPHTHSAEHIQFRLPHSLHKEIHKAFYITPQYIRIWVHSGSQHKKIRMIWYFCMEFIKWQIIYKLYANIK